MRLNALLAEFIGTFALVFIGIGSIAASAIAGGGGTLVGVALAHGLVVCAMGTAVGHISGGHFNPAVSFGLLIGKKIDLGTFFGYVITQCMAGVVAALLIKIVVPVDTLTTIGMGTPSLNAAIGVTPLMGVVTEAVITFFLVFVVFGSAVDNRAPKLGALFIGLTLTLDILMAGPLTGGAANPARHLGPALLGGGLDNIWVYWVGPMLGGLAAGIIYPMVMEKK